MTRRTTTFEVKPHRDYPDTHSTAIVTLPSGLVYACTWAGTPTEDEVREAWRTDRKAFSPYNSTTGDH